MRRFVLDIGGRDFVWDCDERVFVIVVKKKQEENGNGAEEDSPSISYQGVPASSGGEAY
jgi:hypothetical protein